MKKNIIPEVSQSRLPYDVLEEIVRGRIEEYLQDMLEEERTEFLCRQKSERGTKGHGVHLRTKESNLLGIAKIWVWLILDDRGLAANRRLK